MNFDPTLIIKSREYGERAINHIGGRTFRIGRIIIEMGGLTGPDVLLKELRGELATILYNSLVEAPFDRVEDQ